MGVRTNIEIGVKVGLNNDLTNTIFSRVKQEVLDTMDRAAGGTYQLAASASLIPVDFWGLTTVRLLYIEADGDIEVTIANGPVNGQPISLKRMIAPASTLAGSVCAYALITCESTGISLSNPSTTAAVNVTVMLVGDLAT